MIAKDLLQRWLWQWNEWGVNLVGRLRRWEDLFNFGLPRHVWPISKTANRSCHRSGTPSYFNELHSAPINSLTILKSSRPTFWYLKFSLLEEIFQKLNSCNRPWATYQIRKFFEIFHNKGVSCFGPSGNLMRSLYGLSVCKAVKSLPLKVMLAHAYAPCRSSGKSSAKRQALR